MAYCKLGGNPTEEDTEDISGLFIFQQRSEDTSIRVYGRACLGYEEIGELDTRALAITTNAYDYATCNNNGAVYNPFVVADPTSDYDNLRDMDFGVDGLGRYRHGDRMTTLYGDNSILNRSMSLY